MRQRVDSCLLFLRLYGALAGILFCHSKSEIRAAEPAVEKAPYNVHDFGAKGDGEADDGPAINHAIAVAINAGPGTTVLIPAGRYRLEAPNGYGEHLSIHRAQGLTIRGEPGTVLLANDPEASIIAIQGSKNVKLSTLTLEQAKCYFSQGVVVAVDPKAIGCDVTIDPRYDEPDAMTLMGCKSFRPFIYADTSAYESSRHFRQIKSQQRTSDRKWHLTFDGGPLDPELTGKKFIIWDDRHRSHAIAGGNDEDCQFEDVTYYGKGAGAMFFISAARGTMIFRRCIATVPPDSEGLLSCSGGGLFPNNRGSLIFDSCVFEKIDDNAADIMTSYVRVLAQTDARTLQLQSNPGFEPGDILAIMDWSRKSERSVAKIVAVVNKPDRTCIATLDRDVEIRRSGAGNSKAGGDARGDGIDRVVDYNLACQSAIFRNCRMQSLRSRALNIKAQNCMIEGCTFFDCEMPAIAAGPELSWSEGPAVRNLTIRNNHFKHCNVNNIDIDCFDADKDCPALDNRNILIEGNHFEDYGEHATLHQTPGCAIHIKNADGVIIRNNIFAAQGAGAAKDAGKLIIERSKNVSVGKNEGLLEGAIQRK